MVYCGVPTVNLQGYLAQLVESITASQPWKLVLVDNMSTDGTREWIKTLGHDIILNPKNYGVAKSWNQILHWGFDHADCEAVFIFGNDTVLHPTTIDNMYQSMMENGKLAVTGHELGSHRERFEGWVNGPVESRYTTAMNFSCFSLTRKLVEKIGFFDENFLVAYFEDNDYHHRMIAAGLEGVRDCWAPFVHYVSRTINEGGIRIDAAFRHNQKYFLEKWGFLPK